MSHNLQKPGTTCLEKLSGQVDVVGHEGTHPEQAHNAPLSYLCALTYFFPGPADAQSMPAALPADSDGSGRGSSESHQQSETQPRSARAARLLRQTSAPPGGHSLCNLTTAIHRVNDR